MTTAPADKPNATELEEFFIRHPEGEDSVVYRDNFDDVKAIHNDGRLDIRIGVDALWTIVTADRYGTAQLTLIERAIAALTEVRDQLERLTPDTAREARCLAQGDWGRCYGREGHPGNHEFPTEANWRAVNNVPTTSGANQ